MGPLGALQGGRADSQEEAVSSLAIDQRNLDKRTVLAKFLAMLVGGLAISLWALSSAGAQSLETEPGIGNAPVGHSLSNDDRVTNELTAAAVGEELRNRCPYIHARFIVAYSKALALKNYAHSKGHSTEDIEAFLNNDAERSRIFALRDQYLQRNGAVRGDVWSYCTIGRTEIEKGTLIGSILRWQ